MSLNERGHQEVGGGGCEEGEFFSSAAFLLSTPVFRVFALLVFSLHCYMT